MVTREIELFWNNFEIISVFYFTCNHVLTEVCQRWQDGFYVDPWHKRVTWRSPSSWPPAAWHNWPPHWCPKLQLLELLPLLLEGGACKPIYVFADRLTNKHRCRFFLLLLETLSACSLARWQRIVKYWLTSGDRRRQIVLAAFDISRRRPCVYRMSL